MLDKQGRTPEEAAKYWHDAYWDMMFKKYCNLPVSLVPDKTKFLSFKDWWNNQLDVIKHQYLRAKGLEKKNYKQASMLMERDFTIRQLKEELNKMNTMKEEQQVVDNIIDLEAVKARMGSKLPPDGNWLKDFKAGTRFLAYMKTSATSMLGDFILGTNPNELPAVYLGYDLGPQGFGWRWHDPVKFCKEFGLYSILEVSDGNSNSIPEGTVEGDGKLKVVDTVHETE